MTPEQFAGEQREFLIRTDKRSAVLILAEFEKMKREIQLFLAQTTDRKTLLNLYAANYLERILLLFEDHLDVLAIPFSQIVTRAQRSVINFAPESLKKFLQMELDAEIFRIDREAIQKLIGRTYDGKSLGKFFARMKEPLKDRVRRELVEGFALGESNQTIARRINTVADFGLTRALTLSRTETNEAYRAASRDFYREAEIREYVWMSVLDPRTCLTCWFLHGQKFKTSVKVFSHPNCRCTLVPFRKNQKAITTGAESFLKLETGFQKQILGNSRFEMFRAGAKLESFVGVKKSDDFGQSYFVKSLAELSEM